MITEEEFNVFQEQLIQLGQTNFALKEKLDTLKEKNAQLPKLKAQYSEIEQQKKESREKNVRTILELRNRLKNLKTQYIKQSEFNEKVVNNRIEEVSNQIYKMEASNEERESIIYQKKYQIKTIKTEISQKSELLEKLNQRNKRVSQLSAFMAMTPSIVLYIEDLQSKITNLQIKKTNNTQELATLDQQVAELRNSEATLDQRISLKNSELNNLQTSFAKLETEISNIKKSIENTKHEIDVKTQKYNETKDQIEDIIKTRKTQLTKFDDLIKEQKLQLEEYTHSKSKAESEQTQMQELVKQEKMRNLDVVQELRKRLNSLIETGDDSDIPKIDRDLRLQISKISEENKMMKDKTVMLRQAINLINEELKSKQNELRKITLLSQPNPKLLANTNFQILETLLEETILQNKQLLVRQSEISNEIDKLRAEKLNNN